MSTMAFTPSAKTFLQGQFVARLKLSLFWGHFVLRPMLSSQTIGPGTVRWYNHCPFGADKLGKPLISLWQDFEVLLPPSPPRLSNLNC